MGFIFNHRIRVLSIIIVLLFYCVKGECKGFNDLLLLSENIQNEEIIIEYEDESLEDDSEIGIDYEEDEDDFQIEYDDESDPGLEIIGEDDFKEEKKDLSIKGFLELESFINTNLNDDLKDLEKKTELRGCLKIKKGSDDFYLFSRSNLYLYMPLNGEQNYHYADESRTDRNYTSSSKNFEISFNELYLNISDEKYRVRLGNQIYGWGTADAFNPTSYFNPYDLREFFFKDEDELKQPSPSISGLYFFNDFTIETVIVPVFDKSRYASGDDFWAIDLGNYNMPVIINDSRQPEGSQDDFGIGTRLTATIGSGDYSISMFHGPDKDAVFTPIQTIISDNDLVSIMVNPYYDT